MSWLGEFRRMPAALLEEIKATPQDAYARIDSLNDMLDLDRAWQRLAALMDRADFPVNPITDGTVFPDERHGFGRDGDSRALTAEQVAVAAAHLARTPFEALGVHLRPLLDTEKWVPIPDPLLEPPALPEDGVYLRVDDETEQAIRRTLTASYAELVDFFAAAAGEGQCTVFWAA